MNLLRTLTMLLAVTQASVPTSGQASNQPNGKHTAQRQHAESGQAPAPPSVPSSKPDLKGGTAESDSDDEEPAADKGTVNISQVATVPITWSLHERIAWGANLLLTIAGCAGVYYAGRTVHATSKAVDAALKQATYMVNSERAWILVDTGIIPDDFEPDLGTIEIMDIRPVLTNYGKTPGRVIRVAIRKHIVPSTETLPNIPEYLNVTETDITLPPNIPLQPMGTMVALGDFVDIRAGKSVLYFYGFVEYEDFARETRCSRFCFVYLLGGGFTSMKRGFYIATQVPNAYTTND